ncbi:putative ubiquitin-like-specific protease [Triangularia setosa]|uniref:Ubiquitin-like-specific protease n=1 Tax=Triangularia setosa TaxID=2587417 RepID=A0AAN6WBE3_9PEZI|nr:putative ubiquitin-like-specific protease [Podospora setosa]
MPLQGFLSRITSLGRSFNNLDSTSPPTERPPSSRSNATRATPPTKRQKTGQYTEVIPRGPEEDIEDFPYHSIRARGHTSSLSISPSPVSSDCHGWNHQQMPEQQNRGPRRHRDRSHGSIKSRSSAGDDNDIDLLSQDHIDPSKHRTARFPGVKADAADEAILIGMRGNSSSAHKPNNSKKRSSYDAHEEDGLTSGHASNKGKRRQGPSSISHRSDLTPAQFFTKPASGSAKRHRHTEPLFVRVLAAACYDKYLYATSDENVCYLYPISDNGSTAELCAVTQDGKPHPEQSWLKIASKANTLYHNPNCPYIKIQQSKDNRHNIGSLLIIKLDTPADASSVVDWTRDNLKSVLILEGERLHATWDKVCGDVHRKLSTSKKDIGAESTPPPPVDGLSQSTSPGITPGKVSPSSKPRTTIRDFMQVSAPMTPKPATTYGRRSSRLTRNAPTAYPIESLSPSPPPPPAPRWSEQNKSWREDWKTPLQFGRVQVTKEDIPRLDEGQYLNDSIIEFGLKYLFEKFANRHIDLSRRVYMHNSFFYTSLTGGDGNKFKYENVKRWTAKVDLLSHDYVVVPINQNFHWWVAIICNPGKLDPDARQKRKEAAVSSDAEMTDAPEPVRSDALDLAADDKDLGFRKALHAQPKQRKAAYSLDDPRIILLDSLGSGHGPVVKNLREYLVAEFQDKRGRTLTSTDLPPRLGMKAVNIPQQPNLTDCGVYLLGYMQQFVRNPDEFVECLLAKEKIAWTLSAPELRKLWRDTIFDEKAGKSTAMPVNRETSLFAKSANQSISPLRGSIAAVMAVDKGTQPTGEAAKSVEIATKPVQDAPGHVAEPAEAVKETATNDIGNHIDLVESIEDSPTPEPPQITNLSMPSEPGMSCLVRHSNDVPKPKERSIPKPATSPAQHSSQLEEDEVVLVGRPDVHLFTARISSSPAVPKKGVDLPIQEADAASFYKKSATPSEHTNNAKVRQPTRQVAMMPRSSPVRASHPKRPVASSPHTGASTSKRPNASSTPTGTPHSKRPGASPPPTMASHSRYFNIASSPARRRVATNATTKQLPTYTSMASAPTRETTVAENLAAVKHQEPISIDDSD